eukprot:3691084-Alexandrium_andersonii.AAC.1
MGRVRLQGMGRHWGDVCSCIRTVACSDGRVGWSHAFRLSSVQPRLPPRQAAPSAWGAPAAPAAPARRAKRESPPRRSSGRATNRVWLAIATLRSGGEDLRSSAGLRLPSAGRCDCELNLCSKGLLRRPRDAGDARQGARHGALTMTTNDGGAWLVEVGGGVVGKGGAGQVLRGGARRSGALWGWRVGSGEAAYSGIGLEGVGAGLRGLA